MADANDIPRPKNTGSRFSAWHLLPFVFFVAGYFLVPRYAQDKEITTLIYIGIGSLLALGLNLLMGYAGQVSLGHAAFFGLGAYTSAILAVRPISGDLIPGFSAGIGVMTGCVALISLTRAAGWRLAAGVAALLALTWVVRLAHITHAPAIGLYAVGSALVGFAVRLGWWKPAIAGIVCGLLWWLSGSFLSAALEAGGTSPWAGMTAGVFVTGLIAYLIGGPVLRLRGHYLAMATLGFGVIVEIVFSQWMAVTGGSSDGIPSVPTIHFIDGLPAPVRGIFEMALGGPVDARRQYFLLVWAFVFLALVLAVNIVRSRVGRAFRAVHGSEAAAESLGVDTGRYKVQVFVLSASLASLAGSLLAHNVPCGYVSPGQFGFLVSVELLAMVVIGGMASVWGALFGATTIQLLKNWMLTLSQSQPVFGLTLKGMEPVVFGLILILVMIVLPQGLVRGLTDIVLASWRTARRAAHRKE
ncbi:MAG: hypothetical protein A2Z18_00520 [Armatimonadetes bacterium RBG_16_58_9]|nr:MAG: hypothetical protein A2Z18_00520 [Armatimonadetes bacterium RBG_16_58_9]